VPLGHHCCLLRPMATVSSALSSELRSLLDEASATGHLHLTSFSLASIPPQVFGLTSLRRLDLSHNELRVLPDRISELTG
jgi:Leucine-rich repeat (LRR) protein